MRHGKNAGHLDPVVATAMRVLPQAMLLKRYALSEILHPTLGHVLKQTALGRDRTLAQFSRFCTFLR